MRLHFLSSNCRKNNVMSSCEEATKTCWAMFAPVAGEGRNAEPREHAHVTGSREVMGSVKAAKAAARGFRESGVKPKEAAKAALTATGAAKREKQKPKRKQPESRPDSDEGPGFKAPRTSHVYAGAALITQHAVL